MKKHKYKVYFKNENIEPTIITANCPAHANILAQAEKIKAGLDRRIDYIEQMDKAYSGF